MKSIVLPAGTEHVPFGELAHLIANALWPDGGDDDNRFKYEAATGNLDSELAKAVTSGALPVKDRLTFGPHTFPHGDALKRALVTVDDLREFVAGRGLSVLFQFSINEDGGSTTFRATKEEYDAMAAGKQAQRDERHKRGHYSMYEAAEVLAAANSIGGAEAFLKIRMRPAVESGALVLLDPIDGGPVTGRLCRPYDDWVTPKAINEWLAGAEFDYRWPVAGAATQAAPVVTDGASDDAEQGLTTSEIAYAFDGVSGWTAERWTKNLSATRMGWAAPALIGLGEQGGASSVWRPLTLAQLIHARAKGDKEKQGGLKMLHSRFNRQTALAPWRDAFNEFFATFSDAD